MVIGPDRGCDAPRDPALAGLHTLALDLATLRRLLSRRDGDGTLIDIDPALIGAAITAGYDEVHRVREMLATVPDEPTAAWRPTVDALDTALHVLDGMLSALEEMLCQMGG